MVWNVCCGIAPAGGSGATRHFRMLAFNAIPHLDTPDRRAAITFA